MGERIRIESEEQGREVNILKSVSSFLESLTDDSSHPKYCCKIVDVKGVGQNLHNRLVRFGFLKPEIPGL